MLKSFKNLVMAVVVVFMSVLLLSDVLRISQSNAAQLGLPEPSTLLMTSDSYQDVVLQGLRLHANDPFKLDFIVDYGNLSNHTDADISRLISYFMTALAMPVGALWVNLSPYEKDRITDSKIMRTPLESDMLAVDYILKQLSSSLTSPDTKLGSKYWSNLNESSDFVNTMTNKVWVVPGNIKVGARDDLLYIKEALLKVETEEDYVANNNANHRMGDQNDLIFFKEHLLPKIENDINYGRNFTKLRQMYFSIILAVNFKRFFNETLLGIVANSEIARGLDINDPAYKEKIYSLYLDSFNKGVYSKIKKDFSKKTRKTTKRHYFSGGLDWNGVASSTIEVFSPHDLNNMLNPGFVETRLDVPEADNLIHANSADIEFANKQFELSENGLILPVAGKIEVVEDPVLKRQRRRAIDDFNAAVEFIASINHLNDFSSNEHYQTLLDSLDNLIALRQLNRKEDLKELIPFSAFLIMLKTLSDTGVRSKILYILETEYLNVDSSDELITYIQSIHQLVPELFVDKQVQSLIYVILKDKPAKAFVELLRFREYRIALNRIFAQTNKRAKFSEGLIDYGFEVLDQMDEIEFIEYVQLLKSHPFKKVSSLPGISKDRTFGIEIELGLLRENDYSAQQSTEKNTELKRFIESNDEFKKVLANLHEIEMDDPEINLNKKIANVEFRTKDGGIRNIKEEVVSFLHDTKVPLVLAQEYLNQNNGYRLSQSMHIHMGTVKSREKARIESGLAYLGKLFEKFYSYNAYSSYANGVGGIITFDNEALYKNTKTIRNQTPFYLTDNNTAAFNIFAPVPLTKINSDEYDDYMMATLTLAAQTYKKAMLGRRKLAKTMGRMVPVLQTHRYNGNIMREQIKFLFNDNKDGAVAVLQLMAKRGAFSENMPKLAKNEESESELDKFSLINGDQYKQLLTNLDFKRFYDAFKNQGMSEGTLKLAVKYFSKVSEYKLFVLSFLNQNDISLLKKALQNENCIFKPYSWVKTLKSEIDIESIDVDKETGAVSVWGNDGYAFFNKRGKKNEFKKVQGYSVNSLDNGLLFVSSDYGYKFYNSKRELIYHVADFGLVNSFEYDKESKVMTVYYKRLYPRDLFDFKYGLVNKVEIDLKTGVSIVQNDKGYYVFDKNGMKKALVEDHGGITNIEFNAEAGLILVSCKRGYAIYDKNGELLVSENNLGFLESLQYDSGSETILVGATNGFAFYDRFGKEILINRNARSVRKVVIHPESKLLIVSTADSYYVVDRHGNLIASGRDLEDAPKIYINSSTGAIVITTYTKTFFYSANGVLINNEDLNGNNRRVLMHPQTGVILLSSTKGLSVYNNNGILLDFKGALGSSMDCRIDDETGIVYFRATEGYAIYNKAGEIIVSSQEKDVDVDFSLDSGTGMIYVHRLDGHTVYDEYGTVVSQESSSSVGGLDFASVSDSTVFLSQFRYEQSVKFNKSSYACGVLVRIVTAKRLSGKELLAHIN